MSEWNREENFRFSGMNTRIYTDDVLLRGSGWSQETEKARDARLRAREELRKKKLKKEEKNKEKDKIIKRHAKARRGRRLFFILFVCVISVFIGKTLWQLLDLAAEKKDAQLKLEALQKKEYQMEADLEQINSDEYMEQEARSRLHMIYPGETLYKIVEPVDTEADTPEEEQDGTE